MTSNTPLSVWYDGDCPVCRQEVALYRRIDREHRIDWIDIGALADHQLPPGKSRDDLLGRFHARADHDKLGAEGGYDIGVDAFAAIWRRLPLLNRLAFLFRTPGIRQLAKLGYLGFLRWQRGHRARRNAVAKALA
jgi:predicted DCC family thiol-disulfide oxidoreductase YuxK